MRSIPFRTVMEQAFGLSGTPYSATTQEQRNQLASFINARLNEAWTGWPWPQLWKVEQRGFADPYVSTKPYVQGEVVWYGNAYYAATTSTTGNPPTDTDYWTTTATPLPRIIDLEQYASTKIDRVWTVTKSDPRVKQQNYELEWQLTEDGLVVPAAGASVWLCFTEPPELFTAVEYNAAAAVYNRYDRVFYPGTEPAETFPEKGEVFECQQDASSNYFWRIVRFPAVLAPFVIYAAAADMMRYQGSKEVAVQFDAIAAQRRNDEWDKVSPLVRNIGRYP